MPPQMLSIIYCILMSCFFLLALYNYKFMQVGSATDRQLRIFDPGFGTFCDGSQTLKMKNVKFLPGFVFLIVVKINNNPLWTNRQWWLSGLRQQHSKFKLEFVSLINENPCNVEIGYTAIQIAGRLTLWLW